MTTPLSTYDLLLPQRIVFGWGRRTEIGSLGASLGRRAFIVAGSKTLEQNGTLASLSDMLRAAGVEPIHVASISHEPLVSDVDGLASKVGELKAGESDFFVAIGGGSAIDLAKAAAAMATNRESSTVADYLEGVGKGLKLKHTPLPMMAVPTTAGTGSEATKNSVISHFNPNFKKSLRADAMVPRVVLIDPELTVSVPPRTTAYTGMDAITQLIESYISCRARPVPRALAIQGLQLAVPALASAVAEGANRAAREAMAHAALLSGIALANSGLGMAHGVAAALGAECKVTHGLACAIMLPVALRTNRNVSQADLASLGRLVCGVSTLDDAEAADAFIRCIEELAAAIGIPMRLRELGVRPEQIPALVAGSQGNSMAGNPRKIDNRELTEILEKLL